MAWRVRALKFVRGIVSQLLLLCLLVWLIGMWQTRNQPQGRAPALAVMPLNGGEVVSLLRDETRHLRLVYFFAPWCGVCRMSMKSLNFFTSSVLGVNVIAVALDFERPEDVRAFARDVEIEVPIYLGGDDVRQNWHIQAYPTYVIIDHKGQIKTWATGYSTYVGIWARLAFFDIFGL